jgi:alpha-L-fucosidase
VIYFDNHGLPLGQAGLDAAAHYYNASIQWHGKLDVVLNGKMIPDEQAPGLVSDIERGVATGIRPLPWQTDTCIGSWHYQRSLFENHRYKTTTQVVQMLIDIVSKNGNLMLSVPVRGDGTIDEDEVAFLEAMAKWIGVNGEAIYSTRPYTVYGEGPSVTATAPRGQFGGARDVRNYTPQDFRFTARGDTLYAFIMSWPGEQALIASLATDKSPGRVGKVELLGHPGDLAFTHDAQGLSVRLPQNPANEHSNVLKISGLRLQG